MNRRVLIVCYYFPPLGLAGVGRPLNLFTYLPHYGWDTHVLTVKPVAYRGYEPELLSSLDQSRIFRSGSYDPQRLMHLIGWRSPGPATLESTSSLRSKFIPDSKKGWIGPATRLGTRLIREYKYDLILSTSPPISGHLIAAKLHRESGVKWVADFRDYWTSSTIEECYDAPEKVSRAHKILDTIRSESTSMTAVNESVARYVGAKQVITNGYNPTAAESWRAPSRGDRFTIGLLGTFGPLNPVEPLVNLVNSLRAREIDPSSQIAIAHVGNIDATASETLSQLEKAGVKVNFHGRRPRSETIDILNSSHCLFQSLQLNWGRGLTSARIFDSLASGRPIIAYGDSDGEVARLLEKIGNGCPFNDNSAATATDYLARLVQGWRQNSLVVTPRPAYAEPYRWDRIAGQFAHLFETIV